MAEYLDSGYNVRDKAKYLQLSINFTERKVFKTLQLRREKYLNEETMTVVCTTVIVKIFLFERPSTSESSCKDTERVCV